MSDTARKDENPGRGHDRAPDEAGGTPKDLPPGEEPTWGGEGGAGDYTGGPVTSGDGDRVK